MKTKINKRALGMKSFEYSECQRVCEAFAQHMLYSEGLNHINGAYSEAEVYDCDDEFAYIECLTGEQNMGDGHSNEYKSEHQISREILKSNKSLKEKIQAITERINMKAKVKYGSKKLSEMLKRCEVMPDDRLLDIYRNIDWEDFVVIDVGRLCGEIGSRGYEIVEDVYDEEGNCIVEFKPIPLMNKEDKVA